MSDIAPLDVTPLLDTEIAEYLASLPFDIGAMMGSLSDDNVAQMRELFAATPQPPHWNQGCG